VRQATLVGFATALAERSGTGILRQISTQDRRIEPKDIAPEFRAALDRGRAMDIAEGIAYALEDAEVRA
jgi:hypothetical protein